MNFDSWSRKGIIYSSAVTLIYTIAFILVFNSAGGAFSALAVLPAAIAGLYLGISGGLIFSAISVLATIIVFALFGELTVFLQRGIIGAVLIFIIGVGAGWLSDLLRTVQQQSEALKREIEARKQSEETLRTVVNNAPILMWNISKDNTLHVLEGNALQSMRIEAETLVGKSVTELYKSLPDMQAHVEHALRSEIVNNTLSAQDLLFDAHYIPVFDEQKHVQSVIGVATDITEQQQTKTALDEAQTEMTTQQQRINRLYTMIDLMLKQLNSVFQHGASREELKVYMTTLNDEFTQLQEIVTQKNLLDSSM